MPRAAYDFAVTAPGASRAFRALEGVGFQSAFPLRVVQAGAALDFGAGFV